MTRPALCVGVIARCGERAGQEYACLLNSTRRFSALGEGSYRSKLLMRGVALRMAGAAAAEAPDSDVCSAVPVLDDLMSLLYKGPPVCVVDPSSVCLAWEPGR